MSLKLHFEIFAGCAREISSRNIPRDSIGKGGGNIHIENPPELPKGNHEEISAGIIQWNSPTNQRGNLGDVGVQWNSGSGISLAWFTFNCAKGLSEKWVMGFIAISPSPLQNSLLALAHS